MKQHSILTLAALLGAVAVGLGAFGAHGLRDMVPPQDLEIWNTAVRYQIWHALALLGCAVLAPARRLAATVICMATGTVIFSGSLYALVLADARWLGAITPLGGVLMIAGWLLLATVRRGATAPDRDHQ